MWNKLKNVLVDIDYLKRRENGFTEAIQAIRVDTRGCVNENIRLTAEVARLSNLISVMDRDMDDLRRSKKELYDASSHLQFAANHIQYAGEDRRNW